MQNRQRRSLTSVAALGAQNLPLMGVPLPLHVDGDYDTPNLKPGLGTYQWLANHMPALFPNGLHVSQEVGSPEMAVQLPEARLLLNWFSFFYLGV